MPLAGARVSAALRGVRERMHQVPAGAWYRLALVAAMFAVIGLAVLVFGVPSVDTARQAVRSMGVIAPIGFVLGYAALTVTPFPKSVLAVVGGALWGMGWGLLIVLCATWLGALFGFVLGRYLISSSVRTLVGPYMRVVDGAVRRSFWAVLGVRLMPVLPFTLLNYSFGVTAIGVGRFALTTAIGTIPGTLAYVAVGAFGAEPLSWQFWLMLAIVGGMTVIGLLVRARRRSRSGMARAGREAAGSADAGGAELHGDPRTDSR